MLYEKDWILNAATSIKVFINIFIGIWAFVLAYIWAHHIEKRAGDQVRAAESGSVFPNSSSATRSLLAFSWGSASRFQPWSKPNGSFPLPRR